jgi:ABC-type glutathione transport system ATPase component
LIPEFVVTDLVRLFRRTGVAGARTTRAVDGVGFEVRAGQRLGIVGESGSGKSTLVRMMAALLPPTSGSIRFRGQEIVGLPESRLAVLRREVQLVFQDPRSSLDPRMRVGRIISEPLRSAALRRLGDMPPDTDERVAEVMAKVGLDPALADRFPHEFSGGQRQRIAIARALAPRPSILIADEAVSALDVSVRAQVLNLIVDRVLDDGLTLLFVSHDLSVVRHVCDSVIVMRAGKVVEAGPVERVYAAPEQDYTRELLASVPKIRL